jgi:hypothetical protein
VELFGIICSIPAALAASAIYFFAMRWLLRTQPGIATILGPSSALVLAALAVEWTLLGTIGTVRSRAVVGPLFYPLHLVLFLLSLPALANLLILKRRAQESQLLVETAILCTLLALPLVITQYAVSDALYGIDGKGGPYGAD